MKKLRYLLILCAAILIAGALRAATPMTTHHLPEANFEDPAGPWSMTIVANNPSATAAGEVCSSPQCIWYDPYSTTVIPGPDRDGVHPFSFPEGMDVYADIVDPHGQHVFVRDLGEPLVLPVQLMDLVRPGFVSRLFLYAEEGTAVQISLYVGNLQVVTNSVEVAPGQTKILALATDITRVTVTPGWPPGAPGPQPEFHGFYILALRSHQPMGELNVVRPLPYNPNP